MSHLCITSMSFHYPLSKIWCRSILQSRPPFPGHTPHWFPFCSRDIPSRLMPQALLSFFWLSQVLSDVCKLSLAVAGAQASYCSHISCCRAQAPSAQAQSLRCSGLVAPPHVEYSRSRGHICVSYIGRRIIIHTVLPGKSLFQDLHTCSSLLWVHFPSSLLRLPVCQTSPLQGPLPIQSNI